MLYNCCKIIRIFMIYVYYLLNKQLLNHLECCCMFVSHRSGGKHEIEADKSTRATK